MNWLLGSDADSATLLTPTVGRTQDSAAILREALELQRADRWDESIELLLRSTASESADATALYYLGVAYEHTLRLSEALDAYVKSSELGPALAIAHYRTARTFAALGHSEEAEKYFNSSLRAGNLKTNEYLSGYVTFLRGQNRHADGARVCLAAIASAPGQAKKLRNLLVNCLGSVNPTLPEVREVLTAGFSRGDKILLAAALDALAEVPDSVENPRQALLLYDAGIAFKPDDPRGYHNRARCLVKLNQLDDAADAIGRAINLTPTVTAGQFGDLAYIRRRQRKWWQEVDALQRALELDDTRAEWWFNLGNARDELNDFEEASDAFSRAIAIDPQKAVWHYRLGYALQKAGKLVGSRAAFAQAVSREPSAQSTGVGWFHAQRGLWVPAVEAYQSYLAHLAGTSISERITSPQTANIYYQLGALQERCYRWSDAAESYQNAIAFGYPHSKGHFRLGFVWERLNRLSDAAQAYRVAAESSEKLESYWWYRLGYVLQKAGNFRDAAGAWANMRMDEKSGAAQSFKGSAADAPVAASGAHLENYLASLLDRRTNLLENASTERPHDAECWYMLGSAYEKSKQFKAAISAYENAVARKSEHQPLWYFRLGCLLFGEGRDEDACNAFLETRILRRPHGVDTTAYSKSAGQIQVMHYNEYRDTLAIRPKVILYEANLALSMGCNPYAIFQELLKDAEFADWTHVWSLKDATKFPAECVGKSNVIFVTHDSDLYLRYLATAKYLINNSTFSTYFIRREEQKYLNTWHGTPLKALGKDMNAATEFMGRANTARNLLQATHVLSPNPHTSHVLIDRNDIAGAFSGKLAETGYPRIDRMINASDSLKDALRERMNIASGRPVVLYAPTWRGAMSDVEIDVQQLTDDLVSIASCECQVLFRGHHYSEKALNRGTLPVTVVPSDIDTYELLSIVDVLITDYSSIYFDFLPMNRPIIHYNYDLAEYSSSRGMLYFGMDEMPGTVCLERQALVTALQEHLDTPYVPSETFRKAKASFCAHEDGRSTRRAIDFFFHDAAESVVELPRDDRRSVLFFAGNFAPNGITSSAINLINALDEENYRVCVAIDPSAIEARPLHMEKFFQIPDNVAVLGRAGRMVVSPEERWIVDDFNAKSDLPAEEAWNIYLAAFAREFQRLYGHAQWDAHVDFDGYSRFWSSTFMRTRATDIRKAIYLHNDMPEEFRVKFPYLEGLFRLYRNFDAVVSVSRDMCEVNKRGLAGRYGIAKEAFVACPNVIDGDLIARRAEEPLDQDFADWIGDRTVFVNFGRLSPEKDHAKLIRAFANVHAQNPEGLRLIILGDGPLRPVLQQLVLELGLQGAVDLAGLRSNPFPLLKRADCFVLSSNHEGQPMTLLEAMALNRPIVATDIDGNRGVLKGEYGLLVENSEAGLAAGMTEFLAGKIQSQPFDYSVYRAEALRLFDEAVIGA
jgi:CDP-glycerol glycerophosphotransferase